MRLPLIAASLGRSQREHQSGAPSWRSGPMNHLSGPCLPQRHPGGGAAAIFFFTIWEHLCFLTRWGGEAIKWMLLCVRQTFLAFCRVRDETDGEKQ